MHYWFKNDIKEKRGGFLGMQLGTLSASLLQNMLTVKWVIRADDREHSWTGSLMSPHSLTNFEMQKYFQKVTKFKGVY